MASDAAKENDAAIAGAASAHSNPIVVATMANRTRVQRGVMACLQY